MQSTFFFEKDQIRLKIKHILLRVVVITTKSTFLKIVLRPLLSRRSMLYVGTALPVISSTRRILSVETEIICHYIAPVNSLRDIFIVLSVEYHFTIDVLPVHY